MDADHIIEVRKGQIWRENDPRKERYVQIVKVGNVEAVIQTVEFDGTLWINKPRSRETYANLARFRNGYGGYSFHMQAP